jgi:hypothetical protein
VVGQLFSLCPAGIHSLIQNSRPPSLDGISPQKTLSIQEGDGPSGPHFLALTTKKGRNMNGPIDTKLRDSFDYCLDFWEGAIDAEDEIDLFLREAKNPRQVLTCDDAE